MPETLAQICQVDKTTFWPWLTWSDFSRLPGKKNIAVIVPVAGFSDWGIGHALDAEETVLMNVLAAASEKLAGSVRLLVLPPLRFVAGPETAGAFTVDAPTMLAFVDEVCVSIAAAGFSRVVLLNASPWNEELIDASARDIRIGRGLQMFCINLSALDLDFHPERSHSRRKVQTLITALTDTVPLDTVATAIPAPVWGVDAVPPLPGPALSLEDAKVEGASTLAAAAAHLASLLMEISARPSLPRDGALETISVS